MKATFNKLLTVLFLFSTATFGTHALAEGKGYAEQKVVYHVNYHDNSRHNGMLGNIQNHINGVGEDKIQLKVVMHGSGLELLRHAQNDAQMQAKIDNLKMQGVEFKVCENTLKGRNISLDELYDANASDVVPAGVAEIASLQQQGYMYLRP